MHAYARAMNHGTRSARPKMNSEVAQEIASAKSVRWTEDEARRVAHAAYRKLNEAPEILSSIDAVLKAQVEVLPPDRHRAIRQQKDLQVSILPIWRALKAGEIEPLEGPVSEPVSASSEGLEAVAHPAIIGPLHVAQGATPPEVEFDIAQREDEQETLAPLPDEVQRAIDSPSKERKVMVRWTADEQLIIARESKRLRSAFTDMGVLEAIRKAVYSALPADRQRTITTMGEVKFVPALWTQIDAEERAAVAQREQVEQATAEAERVATEQAQAQAAPPSLQDCTFEALLKAFAAKIGQQLIGAIGEQIQEAVMRQVVETLQGVPLQASAIPEGTKRLHLVPRNHKPRVTVVGLLNQQAEDVKRAYVDTIDFIFIKSQQVGGSGGHGGAGMLSRGSQSDVVIAMTDFIGHDVDSASKHLEVPFVRLTGSVSSLKRWLTHWLNGEVAIASV